MNDYKRKLLELDRMLACCMEPRAYQARELVEELINDKDLLLINKKNLPLKMKKLEDLEEHRLLKKMTGLELPSKLHVKFKAELRLSTIKMIDDYDIKDEEVRKEFEEQIFKELKEDFYYYLENQENQPMSDEILVFRFKNGVPQDR